MPNSKLSDTQRAILNSAIQRGDWSLLPTPQSLKTRGAALKTCLKSLLGRGLAEEVADVSEGQSWRSDGCGRRFGLAITDAGLQAIGAAPNRNESTRSDKDKKVSNARLHKMSAKSNDRTKRPLKRAHAAALKKKAPSKQQILIDLLSRPNGATLDKMMKATGWQRHSVRGALSGALKKKRGLNVTSEKTDDRGRIYRIVEEA